MIKDLKIFFWFLKLGAVLNLYFLGCTFIPPLVFADLKLLIPAQILFIVSIYRCLFPVNYVDNIVVHNSPFSSIFLTRLLATFSEVAFIYQLAYLLRLLNVNHAHWIDVLSWLMIVQVILSQLFVWGAILTGRFLLYFYEELGWGIIFIFNTIGSAYLFMVLDNYFGQELLIQLNLLFGIFYLPWQLIHLRTLRLDAQKKVKDKSFGINLNWNDLMRGLHQSIKIKNQTIEYKAWGGLIGIIWMTAYWATVIPVWVYMIVRKA